MVKNNHFPAALIVGAGFLWSLDTVVRYLPAQEFQQGVLVFWEHLAGLLCLTPLVFFRHRWRELIIAPRDIALVLVIGAAGSGMAGITFTEAMKYLGPGVLLCQMIQPMVVVILAYLFLKERHSGIFFQCAFGVILNAVALGWSNFNFGFPLAGDALGRGILFGLATMLLWGCSTIAGKKLLYTYPPLVLVFWRWVVGAVFTGLWILSTGGEFGSASLRSFQVVSQLFFMGGLCGVFAMFLYYSGLAKLPASTATFVELTYPLFGILLPAAYFQKALSPVQWVGAATLLAVIFAMTGLESSVTVERPRRSA